MKTKNTARFILFTLTLSAMLLSACSGVNIPVTGDNSNVNSSPSTPAIVDNGNSSNSNNANSNDVNSNDANSNYNTNTGSNGNSNDSGIEIVGVVEVITEDTIRINGVTYPLANLAEFTDLLSVGDQIKVRLIVNADGTFTILQLEITPGNDNGSNANSNDANSNSANSNDDNSNNANSNDVNSNSNDDNNGSDSNSNDDNGGNDNGSGGGGNDNGGGDNDNGGNDNG